MVHSGDNWHRNYLGHRVTGPVQVSSRGIEFNVPAGGSGDYVEVHQNGKMDSYYANWDYDATYRDVELMQFTGLKDKNGRDIYEGDILNDGKGNPPVPYGKVVWNPSVGAFNVLENGMYYWLNHGNQIGPLQLKETEVIGNIYENPELLK